MSELPKALQDFSGFINGVGQVGKIEEIKLPPIVLKTEEFIAGGMAGPVDVSLGDLEKLDCEMNFISHSPVIIGHLGKADLPFTARGAQSDGLKTEAIILQMRGLLKEVDMGSFKKGEKGSVKTTFNATYMKITIAGIAALEIDMINGIFIRDGKDLRAEIRVALGLE